MVHSCIKSFYVPYEKLLGLRKKICIFFFFFFFASEIQRRLRCLGCFVSCTMISLPYLFHPCRLLQSLSWLLQYTRLPYPTRSSHKISTSLSNQVLFWCLMFSFHRKSLQRVFSQIVCPDWEGGRRYQQGVRGTTTKYNLGTRKSIEAEFCDIIFVCWSKKKKVTLT